MKQIFLKSFCARCLTLLILALLSTNLAWGEEVTKTYTLSTSDNGKTVTWDDVNWEVGSNAIAASSSNMKLTGTIKVTLPTGATLNKVEITKSNNWGRGATVVFASRTTTLNTFEGSGTFSLTSNKTDAVYTFTKGGESDKNAWVKEIKVTYNEAAAAVNAPTFSVAAGNYTEAQTVELSCATEGASIYYTTDGTEPSAESTPYESAITVDHSMTIKAIAINGDKQSSVATAAYKITTYASLADLVADGDPGTTGYPVTVTLINEVITDFYTSSSDSKHHGVYLKVGEKTIEIYCNDAEVPEAWIEGGTVSGTLSNCIWKDYYGTWELCPSDWTELTYNASTTYNIAIDEIEHGSVSADKTEAAAGIKVTLTPTPSTGYKFGEWDVYKTDEQATKVTVTDNQFTMPAYDVTVSATFTAIPKYTITWSVNGATSTETLEEGTAINFEAPTIDPSAIGGKVFRGWTTTAIDGVATTEPSYLTSAVCNANVTYYAVFADEDNSGEAFYKVTTTLTAGKTYIFGAVKAAASSTLANNTTFGAVAFTNTYDGKNYNWGGRVDLTPDENGKIQANDSKITDACKWFLENITNENHSFKNGSSYLYLGDKAGSTYNGAQSGISTTGNCYIENVNSTCKDAFLLHPSSSSTNIMLYNTNNGYRMYASRAYSNTMTPYVRFYEYDSGKTYSNFITTYVAPAGYKVTLNQVTGGTISADKVDGLAENEEVTLSYELTSGYSFVEWTVLDGDAEEVTVTDNKFDMPASDVEVEATFAPIPVESVALNKSELALETGVSETLTVTITPDDALVQDVTWASDNTAVATVDETGKVTAVAVGTANISATSNNGKVGTCVITVTAAIPWVKVISEPTDWSGEYLLVYEDDGTAYVWTGVDAAKENVTATITKNRILKPFGAVSLIVESAMEKYTIKINGGNNDGKYIGNTNQKNNAADNGFSFSDTKSTDAGYLTTFTISDNAAKIAVNKNGETSLRFNSNSDQQRFRYYKNGQQAVQLYRKSVEVTISDAGAATYSNAEALDFTDADIDAYIAPNGVDGNTITMTKVGAVAANTGLYIKGDAGTYYIPVAVKGTDYSETNKLKAVVTATTVEPTEGGLYNYVLQSQNGNVGFYYLTEAREIGANKAYLQLNSQIGNGAKVELLFYDEPTGIKSLTPALSEGMGVYNLNGMRVNGNYKGIVIMNGKKYLNK